MSGRVESSLQLWIDVFRSEEMRRLRVLDKRRKRGNHLLEQDHGGEKRRRVIATTTTKEELLPLLTPLPELDTLKTLHNQVLKALNETASMDLPVKLSEFEKILVKHGKMDESILIFLLKKFEFEKLLRLNKTNDLEDIDHLSLSNMLDESPQTAAKANKFDKMNIEDMLQTKSHCEWLESKDYDEANELIAQPSAKQRMMIEKVAASNNIQEFCRHGTLHECRRRRSGCRKVHFMKIIRKHTDESLGDCSFLNTCFNMENCKYVHYCIEYPRGVRIRDDVTSPRASDGQYRVPQWIRCDIRFFDFSCIGKFAIVMADPPWDIHMDLPYGTMSDDEMKNIPIPALQDDGLIFIWVTGRNLENGRECMRHWGYQVVDEIIWVKTNQLQRLIRTGRTGHWLNHGKEHCLVGQKGNPPFNRHIDVDVIVAEVRETSWKPDEVYGILERLCPGERKLELFGRPHNMQPNWLTLGNQMDGVRLVDFDLIESFSRRYPNPNDAMYRPTLVPNDPVAMMTGGGGIITSS